jgi:hypothetical protein
MLLARVSLIKLIGLLIFCAIIYLPLKSVHRFFIQEFVHADCLKENP